GPPLVTGTAIRRPKPVVSEQSVPTKGASMRILKRAVPLALVLVLGSQGSALATTRNITIADFSFTPKVTRARLGDTVKVRFNSKGHPLGKYQFRARLRNTSNHHVSGFSPAVTITVS